MNTINKEKTINLRKMCYKRKVNRLIQRTEERSSLPQKVTGLISGADLRILATIDYTASPYTVVSCILVMKMPLV